MSTTNSVPDVGPESRQDEVLETPTEETSDPPSDPPIDPRSVIVCSFFTGDDYYRGHANTLRTNLSRLGIESVLEEIQKGEGEDWADICRKKIGFLARVCQENPDRKVFWIDVDCSLLSLPEYVSEFTADLIGFQRGFASPLTIGYGTRTRFWEPCFFGINTTPQARKFMADAATAEREMDIKATDDYFFEESWRANAGQMSFQIIPSVAVLSKATLGVGDVQAFFSFGASGSVAEFKDKVAQHGYIGGGQGPSMVVRARRRALRAAKRFERGLPARSSGLLRKAADRLGVTHALTGGADAFGGVGGPASAHRARILREVMSLGQRGETETMQARYQTLEASGVPSGPELATKMAAESFATFATAAPDREPLRLVWWPRPFPGNFGDWLSPLVLGHVSGRSVTYQSPTARSEDPHLISIGSIGRFIKPRSVVVGTGVSSTEILLESKAQYVSLRGPLTAQLLKDSGGPLVDSFGDPGALISRVLPVERGETNGRIALVRHFTHASAPLTLTEDMDELNVIRSHPDSMRRFVDSLNAYDSVVTSAMHVMIACHSYGIPCVLVTFEGLESSVHGSGMKYRDYALGVGLETVYEPVVVAMDLRRESLESRMSLATISEAKLDEIDQALRRGVDRYLEMLG